MIGPRFLVAIGKSHAGTFGGAETMTNVMETDNLRVLVEPGGAFVLLPRGQGIIIGRLFRFGSRTPVTTLQDREAEEIVRTRAASLSRSYWGAFVAFLCAGPGEEVIVYRDPSPEKPCYYAAKGDALVVASDYMLLRDIAKVRMTFDWSPIAALLWRPDIRPRRTAFNGLSELLAGEQMILSEHRRDLDMLWTPWAFAERSGFFAREEEAVAALRTAVDDAVTSWAGLFRHVVLGVSGGLDSSIVATIVAQTRTRLTMATLVAPGRAGDERRFSRELGEYLDNEVLEIPEDPHSVDLSWSDASHLPRPVARSFSQSADRAFDRIADRVGADGFFTGGGGDNVFCYLTSGAPLADRWKLEGLTPASFRTATDISRLTGASLLAVLSNAYRRGWRRPADYRWPLKGRFLVPGSVHAVREVGDHPWMMVPPGGLPGKAIHIAWLLGIQNYLEGFARERIKPIVSPLMAQPVMEVCLRIPTWWWVSGGVNRACARKAYADRLPKRVLSRTSKGTPDSFVIELIEQRRNEIADILLSGRLVREGLADADAIEQSVRNLSIVRDVGFVELMKLVDVEAWLSSVEPGATSVQDAAPISP